MPGNIELQRFIIMALCILVENHKGPSIPTNTYIVKSTFAVLTTKASGTYMDNKPWRQAIRFSALSGVEMPWSNNRPDDGYVRTSHLVSRGGF